MKNNLKVYRATHNMTQAELAQTIKVSRQTINAMENNRYAPNTVLALKVARHFKVAVEQLFQLDDTE